MWCGVTLRPGEKVSRIKALEGVLKRLILALHRLIPRVETLIPPLAMLIQVAERLSQPVEKVSQNPRPNEIPLWSVGRSCDRLGDGGKRPQDPPTLRSLGGDFAKSEAVSGTGAGRRRILALSGPARKSQRPPPAEGFERPHSDSEGQVSPASKAFGVGRLCGTLW